MTSQPLFSIITVTRNNLSGLQKTYKTINEQTSQNFEWIIIDGASDDGTIEFLSTQNINHTSEKDNGIYDAMNKGLKHVTGQYVLFVNAGDGFAGEDTLEKIEQRLDNQPYDFIYGDSLEIKQGTQTYKRAQSHSKIMNGMFTHHQAMLYKADIVKTITYNETYHVAADYDFTWCALNNAKNTLYLDFPLCVFEAGGLSQQQVLKGRIEQFKIRRTHNVALIINVKIFTLQAMAYRLRVLFPKIYWHLKR